MIDSGRRQFKNQGIAFKNDKQSYIV